MHKILQILFVLIFFLSCEMYRPGEIIDEGEKIIEQYKNEFEQIVTVANSIALDSCTMYEIHISSSTDFFMFSKFHFNNKDSSVEQGDFVDISGENKNIIRGLLPTKEITKFNFVKSLYTSFELSNYRNYDRKYVKIIYSHNKDYLQRLFPNYVFYNNENKTKVIEKSHWVYFYDDNWAITTSSTFYRMSNDECLQIIK